MVFIRMKITEHAFKIKKAGCAPAMPIRQSGEQWVGGDLFARHFYYR